MEQICKLGHSAQALSVGDILHSDPSSSQVLRRMHAMNGRAVDVGLDTRVRYDIIRKAVVLV